MITIIIQTISLREVTDMLIPQQQRLHVLCNEVEDKMCIYQHQQSAKRSHKYLQKPISCIPHLYSFQWLRICWRKGGAPHIIEPNRTNNT